MKPIKILLILTTLLLPLVTAEAREWSGEIRMTFGKTNWIPSTPIRVRADSKGNLHAMYNYCGYSDSVYTGDSPVYQKFDRYGVPLCDPVIIAHEANIPQGQKYNDGFDLFIDQNDYVYLLWGSDYRWAYQSFHVAIWDSTGQLTQPDVLLKGIIATGTFADDLPAIVVDRNKRITVLASCANLDLEPRFLAMMYGRWTINGELLDTLHLLNEHYDFKTYRMYLGSGDTIHIGYQETTDKYYVHYFQIAPDDSRVVDDFLLPSIGWDQGILFGGGISANKANEPTLLVLDNSDHYMVGLSAIGEYRFQNYLSKDNGTAIVGRILTDDQDVIHVFQDFDDDAISRRRSLCYTSLADNGDFVDSIQVIHDASMREGGTGGRNANWGYPDIVSGPEGYVGVFWCDDRFLTGAVAGEMGAELMMRYSIDPLTIPRLLLPNSCGFQLLPNYPNPFNSTTVLGFEAFTRGYYTVTLTDANGRAVFLSPFDLAVPQRIVIPFTGSSLPSGSYFISVTDGNLRLSRMINLVK